jgi:hypothetical protein
MSDLPMPAWSFRYLRVTGGGANRQMVLEW